MAKNGESRQPVPRTIKPISEQNIHTPIMCSHVLCSLHKGRHVGRRHCQWEATHFVYYE